MLLIHKFYWPFMSGAMELIIEGLRNPLNSWDKSDSKWNYSDNFNEEYYEVGTKDLELMEKLALAGSEHAKYRRMIPIWIDMTAPLYWWKEFDTYKIGTVCNSCSTMHTIHKKKFELDDFAENHLMEFEGGPRSVMQLTIDMLNKLRELYLDTKDPNYWYQMIEMLPSSYYQKRTIMLNYEVLANIYKQRRGHKLWEWHTFREWIESLPYFDEIIWPEGSKEVYGDAD